MELKNLMKAPSPDADEEQEEGAAESGSMSQLQARLDKIEKHLGLGKKPKTPDEILRGRARS